MSSAILLLFVHYMFSLYLYIMGIMLRIHELHARRTGNGVDYTIHYCSFRERKMYTGRVGRCIRYAAVGLSDDGASAAAQGRDVGMFKKRCVVKTLR